MEPFKIGYRTLKTALGAAAAIWIAQMLELEFYSSAGILTILCIKITKKRSLISSWERILACLIGIVIASVIFSIIGYHPAALALLFLLFIPVAVSFKAKEGIITSSVIILHLYSVKKLSWDIISNELALIAIGVGTALAANLYMPSMERELKKLQQEIEVKFKLIFHEFYLYLHLDSHDWDGKEITECAALIKKAKSLAFRDVENHFARYENEYYHYFKMREKQFEIIEQMLPIISSIDKSYIQGEKLGLFCESLSEGVHPGNTAVLFLNRLQQMRHEFREMPLPKTREEFETRSKLFFLLNEVEQYLEIKKTFKKSDV
ncbi:aromatic acid exporter family protein [Fictibacillus iocasae]|uniref:Aromatic acid exporter family protein n=1 Tax=Fictibacillus iocasae TaxID=2715437 RepID=A0ABW2NIH2_9BACL